VVDVLILGGGVAGLSAAAEASGHGQVLVVTKDSVRESTTGYAQGGVAAVLGGDDSFEAHCQDTMQVGGGLCESAAVEAVVSEGPARIRELIEWGGHFDTDEGALHLTREGGHSRRRVVHAGGDATGLEVQKTLVRRARGAESVEVWEYTFAVDLLVDGGRCRGAVVLKDRREPVVIGARSTILATGGAGQIYRETSNPEIATGDGHAMARRAGVAIGDMEFVQFHPTTLYVAGAARQLITEAVRGEGGHLVDSRGERFVFNYHPDGELAPRDVVSRAIVSQIALTGDSCCWLDLTHLGPEIRKRFPGLTRTCAIYDLDITKDLIPVHPSAHYMIGGCLTDQDGRTRLPGLYAAGEVALSGIHGANRLASNSLLEGLVFGRRAGAAAGLEGAPVAERIDIPDPGPSLEESLIDVPDLKNSIKSVMWRRVGVMRREQELAEAERMMTQWQSYVERTAFRQVEGLELRNMLDVALSVTRGARWRRESRGTHHRVDHPQRDDARYGVHSIQTGKGGVVAQPLA
jgi:L-aspartate oxidase